eukprot:TRINITY_DN68023_c0_g3_i2.p1 TRINITY_DN68023_c0_g3~~TRINITY_DN68023_c0_g3_i2.p1  ORF type:complete len:244 (-),score=62.64 TRINITY_DN68023_c0_g3_i2:53-721(-)
MAAAAVSVRAVSVGSPAASPTHFHVPGSPSAMAVGRSSRFLFPSPESTSAPKSSSRWQGRRSTSSSTASPELVPRRRLQLTQRGSPHMGVNTSSPSVRVLHSDSVSSSGSAELSYVAPNGQSSLSHVPEAHAVDSMPFSIGRSMVQQEQQVEQEGQTQEQDVHQQCLHGLELDDVDANALQQQIQARQQAIRATMGRQLSLSDVCELDDAAELGRLSDSDTT